MAREPAWPRAVSFPDFSDLAQVFPKEGLTPKQKEAIKIVGRSFFEEDMSLAQRIRQREITEPTLPLRQALRTKET